MKRFLRYPLWHAVFIGCITLYCFTGCQQKKLAPAPTDYERKHKGHHPIAGSNPQGWNTYTVVVLVAAKHNIGVDTVAQMTQQFAEIFETGLASIGPVFPKQFISHKEDLLPPNLVPDFFRAQQKTFGLSRAEVGAIVYDFYLLGGSTREFPDPCVDNQTQYTDDNE